MLKFDKYQKRPRKGVERSVSRKAKKCEKWNKQLCRKMLYMEFRKTIDMKALKIVFGGVIIIGGVWLEIEKPN